MAHCPMLLTHARRVRLGMNNLMINGQAQASDAARARHSQAARLMLCSKLTAAAPCARRPVRKPQSGPCSNYQQAPTSKEVDGEWAGRRAHLRAHGHGHAPRANAPRVLSAPRGLCGTPVVRSGSCFDPHCTTRMRFVRATRRTAGTPGRKPPRVCAPLRRASSSSSITQ